MTGKDTATEALPASAGNPTWKGVSEAAQALRRSSPLARDFIIHAIGQVRILQKAYAGTMHALIFWGVTVQVIGTIINLMQMQLFVPFVELAFPRGAAYLTYELVMDLAGAAILVGVGMAALRRAVLRPKSLETRWDDVFALVLLALIPLAGFALEATRLVSTAPAWANWSPIGGLLASSFRRLGMTPQTAASLHGSLFWVHAALGLGLAASIPFTKLRHLVATPLNVIFHPRRAAGALEFIPDIEEAETLGVGQITEFAPHQLLAFDACVRCGRCEDACPAAASGMSYTPRLFIQSLRQAMVDTLVNPDGKPVQELLGEALPEDMPWFCTTCGACLAHCPAFVNPVEEIIDLRRYQALTTGKLPKSVADVLRNVERQGNPWGIPAEDRGAWAEGLGIRQLEPGGETDVLLFLGCAFAYDERNKKVARSFVRLLQVAGVDFATLGVDETCCGETARRMGHEYIFQMFAQQNIETFKGVKFKRIVTQCPHCFNTLKNEYPQLGGDFKVQHYTEYLAELTASNGHGAQLDLRSKNGNGVQGRLTYHDSCYLGRYNQIYAQPRQLLDRAGLEKVEMKRRGEDSFCCGGGGGQMWMETDANTRINHHRLEDALETQAEVVATACPYCLLMFDDAIRSKGLGEKIQVLDIAEVLEHQLSSNT
jgi:Fe-S oxidoreductase/nitrate reductase gamma subunit